MLSSKQDLRSMEAKGRAVDLLVTHRADSSAPAAGSEAVDAAAAGVDRLPLRTAEQQ